MQTRTKRKGFTLVELVVVVAVIAVLSAILIPTIGCFVEEAKESNDMATVRLLNVALVEDGASHDTPKTMTDAISAMKRQGYDIEKLNPRSTGEILWDSVNNRFLLRKGDKDLYRDNTGKPAEGIALWRVAKNVNDKSDAYSNYLALDDSFNGDIGTFTTGVDVGENKQVTAVKYAHSGESQSVIVRTDGGELTVDAAGDTVYHYDFVKNLKVIAVSSDHCYYEYGFVGYLDQFDAGKFVATDKARFFQTKDAIVSILNGKESVLDVGEAYEQNLYDENGLSRIDGQPREEHEHIEVIDKAVPATCTTAGKTEGTHCSICKAVIKAQTTIPALGHQWETVVTAETETTNGEVKKVCSVCSVEEDKHTVSSDSALIEESKVARIVHGNGYATVQEAVNAAQNGETVKLLADVTLTDVLTIAADKELSIDLNGKTINGTQGGYNQPLHSEYIIYNEGCIKSLKNGFVESKSAGTSYNDVNSFSALKNVGIIESVENVTIRNTNSMGRAISNYGTIEVIDNSEILSVKDSYIFYNFALLNNGQIDTISNSVIKVENLNGKLNYGRDSNAIRNNVNGTIRCVENSEIYSGMSTAVYNDGEISIESGKVFGSLLGGGLYTISGGEYTVEPDFNQFKINYVAVANSDETYKYTVNNDATAYNNLGAELPFVASVISGSTEIRYKSVTRAASDAKNGGIVKLIANVTNQQVILRGSVTLDLNGCTITSDLSNKLDNLITVYGENVTITDTSADKSGAISQRASNVLAAVKVSGSKAKLTLLAGTIYGKSETHGGTGNNAYGVSVSGGTFDMRGGTVYAGNYFGISVSAGGTLNLYDGEIINDIGALHCAIEIESSNGNSTVNMYGGKITMSTDKVTTDTVFHILNGKTTYHGTLNITGGEINVTNTNANGTTKIINKDADSEPNAVITVSGLNITSVTKEADDLVITDDTTAIIKNITINGQHYDEYPAA